MAVVAVGGGGLGWGTWEELVLGGAVLRHGDAAWASVADELRTRSPCAFSPEECEAKFAEIQSRYSACNAWFEELRKQRVAELKRELEKSENSIGSLQSVIESLSNSKQHGDGTSECRTSHTESCSHSGNTADTNSSGKETSRDRSSAASFTEEGSNSQKPQQAQRYDTDSIQANNPSPDDSYPQGQVAKVGPKDSLLWGSRKPRGRRARRIILLKGDESIRDGEPKSTACKEREGSSEGCMKNLKTPNVESVVVKKGLKTPKVEPSVMKGLKTPKVEPSVMKDLKTPNVGSGVMKKGLKTPNVESDVMKMGLKTPKTEPDVLKKGLKTPKAEPDVLKKGLKTPKAEPEVMKKGMKPPKAESSQHVIERVKTKLAEILNTISTQCDCLTLQRRLDSQRKRARYKKMIRQHMDFRILHSKIKSGTISSTKELLRDMLIFVNNVITFYPKATLEHMAAVELRGLACRTVKQGACFLLKSCGETGTIGAPVVKNAQALEPGRPGPGDSRGSKVSSRGATAKESEGKNSRNDASVTANQKTTQKNEPAKKRGVGRPPKSGQSQSAGAQEDNPSKGRKRSAGAQVASPSKGRKRGAAGAGLEDSLSKGGKKSRR